MSGIVGTQIDADCFTALGRALGRNDETLAATHSSVALPFPQGTRSVQTDGLGTFSPRWGPSLSPESKAV
jgi:hypothetical protein